MDTVLFLRGINVGRGPRVAMADLRALLDRLGATRVRTVLNSGNARFDHVDPGSLERAVHDSLFQQIGARITCLTVPTATIAEIMATTPFAAADTAVLVAFVRSGGAFPTVRGTGAGPEPVAETHGVRQLHLLRGQLESDVATTWLRCPDLTTRTRATLARILAS